MEYTIYITHSKPQIFWVTKKSPFLKEFACIMLIFVGSRFAWVVTIPIKGSTLSQ
jgi:hypothetical protein